MKRLRRARHPGRLFPDLPQELRRPAVFTWLFWGVLAVTVLSWFDREPRFGLLPALLAIGVLVAIWTVLPWNPRAPLPGKLLAPVFLAALSGAIYVAGTEPLMFLYLVVFANGVFLFGFLGGVAYAALTLITVFVNFLVVFRIHGTTLDLADPRFAGPAQTWTDVLYQTAPFVPVAVFVIGLCMSVVEAVRRREETQDLLTELETTHTELQRYTSSVRELAISEERTRVAREVHDTVGHYLTVVSLQLEAARKVLEKKPERSRDAVEKAQKSASEALSEVRRSVRALKPLAVEERSGTGALAALVRSFEGTGPFVSFEVKGHEQELPPEVELVLYRALQEGLTNAVRHSDAHRVEVSLDFEAAHVRLSVSDDGTGASGGSFVQGFGLLALRERVEPLGGTLEAGNGSGGGFVLSVEIPYAPRGAS